MRKALLITILFAVTGLVAAQDQGQAQPQGDAQYGPPADGGRSSGVNPGGVARLSLIRGSVSMQRGDSGDWVATTVNTPLVSGDIVATGDGGRAEVQLDYANVLRLAPQTQAKIADLSSGHIQVQVAQGYANLSTFNGGDAQVEIDTPNVSIHPVRNGKYRVEVTSDAESNLIVREGEAEVSTAQGSTNVKEGEIITIRGTDDPEYKVDQAPGGDDWDRWNQDRDNSISNAQSVRQTNQYYTGAQDLDTYGRWVNIPGYGQVWQPYDQPANWAPYQAGQWVWEPYYGWTWVSSEPWGWAPYHYGRWFYYDTDWYWWPGAVTPYYRPIWSPAFVTFIGFGPHVDFGFGFSSIGWFPCGPFDSFYPWWGAGFNRFGGIDIAFFNRGFGFRDRDRFFDRDRFGRGRDGFRGRGFSNFNAAFNNPRVRAGITSVNAENFGRGGARFRHGVDEGTLRQARVAQGNLGVVPTRESLSARGFASAPAGIRGGAANHFFSRTPTKAVPSFREQTNRMQEAIRTHGGGVQGNTRFGGGTSTHGGFARNDAGAMARGGAATNGANQGRFGNDSSRFGTHTFGGSNPGSNPGSNRDFHPFNQPRSGQGNENGNGRGGFSGNSSPNFPQNRSSGGGGWQPPSNSRTRLDLSKPIVVPRGQASASSGGGYNPGNYRGYSNNNPGNYNRGYSGGAYNGSSRGGNYSGGYSGASRGYSGYSGRSYSGGGGRSYSGYSGRSYSGGGGRSYSGGGRSGGGGGHSSGGHSSSGHSGGHR